MHSLFLLLKGKVLWYIKLIFFKDRARAFQINLLCSDLCRSKRKELLLLIVRERSVRFYFIDSLNFLLDHVLRILNPPLLVPR